MNSITHSQRYLPHIFNTRFYAVWILGHRFWNGGSTQNVDFETVKLNCLAVSRYLLFLQSVIRPPSGSPLV